MIAIVPYLFIALSHGGHCFGGQSLEITMAWSWPQTDSQAVVVWRLGLARTCLGTGQLAVPDWPQSTRLRITFPEVSRLVELVWQYEVRRSGDGAVLHVGVRRISVHPPILGAAIAEQLKHQHTLIISREKRVRALFPAGGPRMHISASIRDAAHLLQARPLFLIALFVHGESMSPWEEEMLRHQAATGCRILVFSVAPRGASKEVIFMTEIDGIDGRSIATADLPTDPTAQQDVRNALLECLGVQNTIAASHADDEIPRWNDKPALDVGHSGVKP